MPLPVHAADRDSFSLRTAPFDGCHRAQVRDLDNATVEAVAPPPEEGDVSAPERVARSAAAFLEAHLRMADVRRYLLDLLKAYSALQTFQVRELRKQQTPQCMLARTAMSKHARIAGSAPNTWRLR